MGDKRESLGHQSPLPLPPVGVGVRTGGGKLRGQKGSGWGDVGQVWGGPCLHLARDASLGFLLGEPISGAGSGGCDFLVKI